MCIFSAEYNIFSKNQYVQYFDAIERLNYTNYHIVYVDDVSSDDSIYEMYELVNTKYKRIRNRMKIIHNLEALGGLGNLYFAPQLFCNEGEVVVNVDPDDQLLGIQALKILSTAYEDENIWYAYSRHIVFMNKTTKNGYSTFLKTPSNIYRRNALFLTSHLRTFRLELMKAVPFYQVIDFHYNTTTKVAWPVFQMLAQDIFQVFAHIELAGNDRVKFI